MATTKGTFTLDEATKSEFVRKAILAFSERIGRPSERERLKLLRTFDEFVPRIPKRSDRQVEQELKAIRRARRSGGRRSLAGIKP